MARVLVAGAAGFVGSAVVRALMRDGHEVVAGARRRPHWPIPPAVTFAEIDVLNPSTLELARVCDAIVNCTAGDPRDTRVIVEGTANLLGIAANAEVAQFIQLSSVAVYGDVSGEIDEHASTARPAGRYGMAKLIAEQACAAFASRLSVAVLRPSLIHGPGSAQWTVPYLDRLLAGEGGDMGAAGEGDCNLIHVDDLADFAGQLIGRPPGSLATYNVNGHEIPSWNQYLSGMAEAVGAPWAARVKPPGIWTLAARKAAKVLLAAGIGDSSLHDFVRRTPSADEVARFARKVRYSTRPMTETGFVPAIRPMDAAQEVAAWHRLGRPPIGWQGYCR